MSTGNKQKAFTVIVGVDYSELSSLALVEAVSAARSRERHHVHVVHSIPIVQTTPFGMSQIAAADTTHAAEELRKYVESVLVEAQGTFPSDGRSIVERLTTHIRLSDPREAIAQLASDLEADLIVVGTHGRRGVSRMLLGSVAEGIVRIAPCPVLVVRKRQAGTAATSEVVKIEPPCPQCLAARQASDGKEFWCAQHREHHERRHTYHFGGAARSGHQSGLLIPLFK